MSLALFYHCWWRRDATRTIMDEQMRTLDECGLQKFVSEIHVGFQGSDEGFSEVSGLWRGRGATIHHVEENAGENPTLKLIHDWVPSHKDWLVCYFHAKGASHNDSTRKWRRCMENAVLWRWRDCVLALQSVDSAGAHWMSNVWGQWFWGGNFWWCTADYLSQLPEPPQNSRWDAEIWVSNVTKTPRVKDIVSDHWLGACP